MRRKTSVVILTVAALVLAAPAYAQVGAKDDLNRSSDPAEPYIPLPTPIATTTSFASDEMQLVGFTDRLFAGNEGVLNMSIACQLEFAGSRMCTMEEISRSVYFPEAAGHGYAWIQMPVEPSAAFETNCNGWMSNSPLHKGVAIDLGACYGGLQEMGCHLHLGVACCAKEGQTPVR